MSERRWMRRRLWALQAPAEVARLRARGKEGEGWRFIDLTPAQRDLRRVSHQTLAKVTDDFGRRRIFNTAIAAVMELLNARVKFTDASEQGRAVVQELLELAVIMLSPIVPHACHALWGMLGHATAMIDESWPAVDATALVQDSVEIVLQVNGKLRGRLNVPAGAGRSVGPRRGAGGRQCDAMDRRESHPEGHRRTRQTGERGGLKIRGPRN